MSNRYKQKYNKSSLLEKAAEQWVKLLTLQLQSSETPTSKTLDCVFSKVNDKGFLYEKTNK